MKFGRARVWRCMRAPTQARRASPVPGLVSVWEQGRMEEPTCAAETLESAYFSRTTLDVRSASWPHLLKGDTLPLGLCSTNFLSKQR
eukprot:CAMPEP_0196581330 /NCGR_PEP_ID=MMETSP1081-20130531/33669_1 /TAXON_ID=36882 /ORGANISM="Pyramimonas amylifera, Strain CCMP720" /LENGTH=86 /DNA_ID=CAMNT_0041901529 /DNA_START=402 /DNA_END=658 /DNA_ORIENTATION=+